MGEKVSMKVQSQGASDLKYTSRYDTISCWKIAVSWKMMTCRTLWAKYLCLHGSYAPEHQVCLLCKSVTVGRCAPRDTVHFELQEIQRRCMRPLLHVQVFGFTSPHCNLLTVASFIHNTPASSGPLHMLIGDRSQQEGPWWNKQPDLTMQNSVRRRRRVDGK